jgi:4'-phosphopantetheinyl transferase
MTGLQDGVCQVWTARAEARPGLEPLLDDVERGRMAAYLRAEDRTRFLLGCAIVRRLLGAHLGIDPAAVPLDRSCPDCSRPHGKVRLRDGADPVQVSVSHSGEYVLVAGHRDAPVGIDVERIDPDLDTRQLAGTVLAPDETSQLDTVPETDRALGFTTYWTRKEALVKATGDGLRSVLAGVVVSGPDQPPALLRWPGREDLIGRVRLHDLPVGAGHVASLAILSERPVEVRQLDATELIETQ